MADDDLQLVCVYRCTNPALVPVIESLLEEADIVYMVKRDQIRELLGWSLFPIAPMSTEAHIEFWVRADEEEEARAALAEVGEE